MKVRSNKCGVPYCVVDCYGARYRLALNEENDLVVVDGKNSVCSWQGLVRPDQAAQAVDALRKFRYES